MTAFSLVKGVLPTPLRMNAPPQYTGRGVTMAFLDSGFYPHPDLTQPQDRILCYVDATLKQPIEKKNFRRPNLSSWHGLMTAGVGAGNGYASDSLYRGIASEANLVLVKTGNRRGHHIREKDIYRALEWVIFNQHRFHIRVVNISLGGDQTANGKMSALDELVEEAAARGMVVVAAAGNGGHERLVSPASAPSALTVGGLDDQNSLDLAQYRMYHSNFGWTPFAPQKPELIAPAIWLAAPMLPKTWVHNEGQLLWKLERGTDEELDAYRRTVAAAARFKKETLALPMAELRGVIRERMREQKYIHAHYQHVDGTSMAAPIVSSIVAQMLEANTTLSPMQVRQILLETAQPLNEVPRARQGYGVVNAAGALARALRAPGGAMEGLSLSPQVGAERVVFYYHNNEARAVTLMVAGDGWRLKARKFRARGNGVWELILPRPPRGNYLYKFWVARDGGADRAQSLYINDPENPARVEDEAGGFSSVLEIS